MKAMSRTGLNYRTALTLFCIFAPTFAQAQTLQTPVNQAMPSIRKDAVEVYLDKTSVDPDCRRNIKPNEIVVCARRAADQWRLPLIISEPGDPKKEGVHDERHRLQYVQNACDLKGPFLIGCGSAGVSVGTSFGGEKVRWRPLAK
jgi:hypothetical protein